MPVTNARSAEHVSMAPIRDDEPVASPRLLDTYALAYAFGSVWLAVAVLGLGTQPAGSFNGVYDALLVMPPVLTALCVLLAGPAGRLRTLPLRAAVLAVVSGIVSVVSTVVLTPVLVLMFRQGVGRNLPLTGTISAASIIVVASPMVVALVRAMREGRFGRVAILLAGVGVTGVALAMAFAPGGALASLLRVDQGEIVMITVSWWLPVYALTAGFARRLGMA